ncbi:hypothetical protein LO762_13990 [Actinocorallia sp. API 0066]|nr:hypothetical protein [Actinocorallia sp. API 0066]MCD0450293.1 hypothetical protein [Actinocorallia sp. API 0066]
MTGASPEPARSGLASSRATILPTRETMSVLSLPRGQPPWSRQVATITPKAVSNPTACADGSPGHPVVSATESRAIRPTVRGNRCA